MRRADIAQFLQDVIGLGRVVEARQAESKSVELRISASEDDGAKDWCEWWGSPTVAFLPAAGDEVLFIDLGSERIVLAVKSRQYQQDLETGECIVRAAGPSGACARLKPDGTIELSRGDAAASSFVPLDDLVQAQFTALKTAISGAAVSTGDGGLAFKNALLTALSSWPASTASTVTRTL